jgi:hypothetical protein
MTPLQALSILYFLEAQRGLTDKQLNRIRQEVKPGWPAMSICRLVRYLQARTTLTKGGDYEKLMLKLKELS